MEAARALGFDQLRSRVLRLTGIDLNQYKGNQLERRLQSLLRRHHVADLAALGQMLERDAKFLQEFKDFLTINVSEFFRNPEKFVELKERFLPELLAARPRLRILSAGCSIGAEIYSVAMILEDLTPGGSHMLLATDIDRACLEKARAAIYNEQEMKSVPLALRERYFRLVDGGWKFDPRLAGQVTFKTHNMLEDVMITDLDLILCRNVVIYFTDEAKERLYRRFYASLRSGGLLFTGGRRRFFKPVKSVFACKLHVFTAKKAERAILTLWKG